MIRSISKSFLRSAACFSVLCALGTGMSVGSLMADNQYPVEKVKLSNNVEITLPTVTWQSGQIFGTNIEVKQTSQCRSALGIDIGTQYTKLVTNSYKDSSGNFFNGVYKILEDRYAKKKKNLNFNFRFESNLLTYGTAGIGVLHEPSYLDYIQALTNQGEHQLYEDDANKYFMKVLIGNYTGYAMAPQGLMLHVKEVHGGGAKYEYDGKSIDLTAEQYKKLKNAVQFAYILRALRIYSGYDGVETFIDILQKGKKEGKKKPLISLTYNAAIQGYEKDCLVNAVKYVFEARGDVNKLDEAWRNVSQNKTDFDYRILPTSVAAQICFQYENAYKIKETGKNKKVIILDYGYNGLSISGAEHRGDGCTIYPDQCFTDCGGKVIDDVLLGYFREKVVEKFTDTSVQNLDARILQQIVPVKEKLSADGASDINVEISDVLPDEDYNGQYSVDQLNELLNNAGIVDNFKNAVNNYIIKHHRELGVRLDNNGNVTSDGKGDFEIVITGGALRIPRLKEIATNVLNNYSNQIKLNQTLNMDECFAYGAAYALYDVDPLKEFKAEEITNFEDGSFKEIQNLVNSSNTEKAYVTLKNDLEESIYALEGLLKWTELGDSIEKFGWKGYLNNKQLVEFSEVISAIAENIKSLQNTTIGQSDIDNIIKTLNELINKLPSDIKSYNGGENVIAAYNELIQAFQDHPTQVKIKLLDNTINTLSEELSNAERFSNERKDALMSKTDSTGIGLLAGYITGLGQDDRNNLIKKANDLAKCCEIKESLPGDSEVDSIVSFILNLRRDRDSIEELDESKSAIGDEKFQSIKENLQKKYQSADLETAVTAFLGCFTSGFDVAHLRVLLAANTKRSFCQHLLDELKGVRGEPSNNSLVTSPSTASSAASTTTKYGISGYNLVILNNNLASLNKAKGEIETELKQKKNTIQESLTNYISILYGENGKRKEKKGELIEKINKVASLSKPVPDTMPRPNDIKVLTDSSKAEDIVEVLFKLRRVANMSIFDTLINVQDQNIAGHFRNLKDTLDKKYNANAGLNDACTDLLNILKEEQGAYTNGEAPKFEILKGIWSKNYKLSTAEDLSKDLREVVGQTRGGFFSTVWSYVKPVLSVPLNAFNWVRSWFW